MAESREEKLRPTKFSNLFEIIKSGKYSDEEKLKIMQELVAQGAPVDAEESPTGRTVIHACAAEGSVEMLTFLFEQCTDAQRNKRDKSDRTVLHHACYGLKENNIAYLLSKKFLPTTTIYGETVLHQAIAGGLLCQNMILVRRIFLMILPYLNDMRPRCQYNVEEQPSSNGFQSPYAHIKTINSPLARLFENYIFDEYLVRFLLGAGLNPNELDGSLKSGVLCRCHQASYLLNHEKFNDPRYLITVLHILGLLIDHGLVENDFFGFKPTDFSPRGNATDTKFHQIIHSWVSALKAQAKKDYAAANKSLSDLPNVCFDNLDIQAQFNSCLAFRRGMISQREGKFEDAYKCFINAKAIYKDCNVSNELAILCVEWYANLNAQRSQELGAWKKLYDQVKNLPFDELTPYTHFVLGQFYLNLNGLKNDDKLKLSCQHFEQVSYGSKRDEAKQKLLLLIGPQVTSSPTASPKVNHKQN